MGQRLACFPGGGAAKATGKVDEATPLRTLAVDQVDEIEEKGWQGYLGSFVCCRVVAPIDFPCLEEHRHDVLWFSHILCIAALFFSFLGFWGGFAHTNTLRSLAWTHIDGVKGPSYAGVKWICWNVPYPPERGTFGDSQSGVIADGTGKYWECETWNDFDCSRAPESSSSCLACKHLVHGLVLSVFMSVFSFVGLLHSTSKRLEGEDSNYVKFSSVISCLIGGSNFLLAALTFWFVCCVNVHAAGVQVETGLGLWFILVAAVFKVVMGFVHLGLPVEKHIEEKIDKKVEA